MVRLPLAAKHLVLLSFSTAVLTGACADHDDVAEPLDAADDSPPATLPEASDAAGFDAPLRLGRPVTSLASTPPARLAIGTRHRLPLTSTLSVSVQVEDYVSERGRIVLTGSVEDSEDSRFLLKSEGDRLFGWVVLRGSDQAYLYESVNGVLEAREVPVEHVFPACNVQGRNGQAQHAEVAERELAAPSGAESWIGSYDGEDLTKLESRPGAEKVLYINIAEAMNGDTPKDFSKEEMWKSWASAAAGYSAFNVNVTTNPSVYAAAGVTNSGVADVFATNEVAACAVGVFGTRIACTIYTGPNAEPEKGYGVGRTLVHEFGHMMGLLHDGNGSEEYAPANQEFRWAPIMGNYYTHSGAEALNQWSKGEYAGASREEDDLAIIARNVPYVADDVPDSKPLVVNGTSVSSAVNRGQIAANTDTDKFTFSITQAGGHASLNLSRIEYYGGAMLDIDARLVNGSGTELAKSNPKAARGASFDVDLPVGDYTLEIKGGAEGTPSDGFSNYSSLGYYGIEGTITGAGTTMGTGGMGGMGGGSGMGGSSGAAGASGSGGSSSGGVSGGGNAAGGAAGNSAGDGGVAGTSGGSAGAGGGVAGAGGASGLGGIDAGGNAGLGGTTPSAGTSAGGASGSAGAGGTAGSAAGAQGGSVPLGGSTSSAGTVSSAGSSTMGSPGGVADDGGCSCRVVSSKRGRPSLWLAGLAAAAVALRRRQRAQR